MIDEMNEICQKMAKEIESLTDQAAKLQDDVRKVFRSVVICVVGLE